MKCLNCQKEFEPKRKDTAKFCSATCRVQYNRVNPKDKVTKVQMQVLYNTMMERLGQIEYKEITEASYGGKKLDKIAYNKPGQWQEPKPKTALKRTPAHWVELRRECSDADEYAQWLENLENDPYLTTREKKDIKATV